jgi:tetratricopeptide (TPR) repeat protein
MIINRDSGDGAVVMVNGGGDAVTSNLKREILIAIADEYGWKNYPPPLMKVVAVTPEKAGRLAGRFQVSPDDVAEVRETDGRWTVEDPAPGVREVFPISGEELVARTILPARFRLVPGKDAAGDTLVITSGDVEVKAPRVSAEQRIPFEYLAAGDVEEGVRLYRALKERDPASPDLREERLNRLGYALLGGNKPAAAVALLKLNTEWHPGSWNAHDSLAEAYLTAGDRQHAIESYEKAIQLNPRSVNSADALKRLKEGP